MKKTVKPYLSPACEELGAVSYAIFLASETDYDGAGISDGDGEIGGFYWD